jgi:hypothetical protein
MKKLIFARKIMANNISTITKKYFNHCKKLSAVLFFLTFSCVGMEEPKKLSEKQQKLIQLISSQAVEHTVIWDKIIEENKVGPAAYIGGVAPIATGLLLITHAFVSLAFGYRINFAKELVVGSGMVALGYQGGEKLCRSEKEAIRHCADELWVENTHFGNLAYSAHQALTQENLYSTQEGKQIVDQFKKIAENRQKQFEQMNKE